MIEVALGIDVGTGSTKVGLVDREGRLLAVGRSAHVITEPHPGWSETDPTSWLSALAEAVNQVVSGNAAQQTVGDLEIVAVGFSGQMHGAVLCDEIVTPVRPAVLWSDQRSQHYLPELRSALNAARSGAAAPANPVVAGMAGSTMAALVDQEPSVVAATSWVLQPKDWVRHALTGRVASDASDGSATLLWDDDQGGWSVEAGGVFGVNMEQLAPVLASDAVAGTVTPAAASQFGLPVGVPVAVGAADTAAALLGAGVGLGETQVSTGTGGQVATSISEPSIDQTGRTHLFRRADHDGEHGWYAMAAMQNVGIAIDWALDLLGADLAAAERAVAVTPVGSDGITFLPYLTGERTPHLNSGLTGRWQGLRPGTTREALIRSVFEGVAYAMADGLDALKDAGHIVDRALLAGGGSTATWWQQLLADVLDLELIPHDAADASVRGAGLLAWSAIGRPVDPGAGVNRLTPIAAGADQAPLAEARQHFQAAAERATQQHQP